MELKGGDKALPCKIRRETKWQKDRLKNLNMSLIIIHADLHYMKMKMKYEEYELVEINE